MKRIELIKLLDAEEMSKKIGKLLDGIDNFCPNCPFYDHCAQDSCSTTVYYWLNEDV